MMIWQETLLSGRYIAEMILKYNCHLRLKEYRVLLNSQTVKSYVVIIMSAFILHS